MFLHYGTMRKSCLGMSRFNRLREDAKVQRKGMRLSRYFVFCILYFAFCILYFVFCILYLWSAPQTGADGAFKQFSPHTRLDVPLRLIDRITGGNRVRLHFHIRGWLSLDFSKCLLWLSFDIFKCLHFHVSIISSLDTQESSCNYHYLIE